MDRLSVIINADDFGMNSVVNGATYDLLKKKAISSATIMANGKEVDEAIRMSKEFPDASFGIHLNLTNFCAVSSEMQSSKFCDANGIFNSQFRELSTFKDTQLIQKEWLAQIQLLRKKGLKISHIDSHHHVHTHPASFFALKSVVELSGINKVRNTRNLVLSSEKTGLSNRIKYFQKKCWSKMLTAHRRVRTTTKFCSVNDFIQIAAHSRNLIPKSGTLELMCHPGDEKNSEYAAECQFLKQDLTRKTGIEFEMTSYLWI